MKLVNLTPHRLDVYNDEGAVAFFAPSGTVARVAEVRESCPPVALGLTVLDVSRATYGAVTGLPEPDGETIYIVSALVAQQCAGRQDVFYPGPAIRDDAGRQVGCHGLSAAPAAPARAELPAIDGIADNVYWGLMGAWIAGGNGGIEPTRAEAARLLRGLSAAVEVSHA